MKIQKLDDRGITLQVVILTAVTALAATGFSVVMYNLFNVQKANTPGNEPGEKSQSVEIDPSQKI